MVDILPSDEVYWKKIFEVSNKISELYDFSYIETPILEPVKLFELSLEKTSDIIRKEMFVFTTKGKEKVALRPEGTAPIVRSYFQHHLNYFFHPLKVYYLGPFFRYERPQQGRYREFRQLGFEILGETDPFYDIIIILTIQRFFSLLGINYKLKINTLGCQVCRPNFRYSLKKYFERYKEELCRDCQMRLEVNPLRILDCKNKKCQEIAKGAPTILDYLCKNCNNHFQRVLEYLEKEKIDYTLDTHLVRGLDYYNRTVFEFVNENGLALAGGGRYDYLAEILGRKKMGAVGGSIGLERVVEELKSKNVKIGSKKPDIFLAVIGKEAKINGLSLLEMIRKANFRITENFSKPSLRVQLKIADKREIPWALILGQKEVYEETIILREMSSGIQEIIPQKKIVEELKKRIKKR